MSPPGSACIRRISSGTTSRTTVAFQSARSRVREKTTFGMSRQMRANSTIGGELSGSVSAVGQNSAINS